VLTLRDAFKEKKGIILIIGLKRINYELLLIVEQRVEWG